MERQHLAKMRHWYATKLEFLIGSVEGGSGHSPREQLPVLSELPKIRPKIGKQKCNHRHRENQHDQRAEMPPAQPAAKPQDPLRLDRRIKVANAEKKIVPGNTAPD